MEHNDLIAQMMVEEGGGAYTARSIVIDIADNYGDNQIGIRSVEFKLSESLIALVAADFAAGATSIGGSRLRAAHGFDTSLSKLGSELDKEWLSSSVGGINQRLWVRVTAGNIIFDELVINNHHSFGGFLGPGAKNMVIQITEDTGTPSSVYNAPVVGGSVIFNSSIAKHVASNVVDDQILDIGL